MTHNTLADSIAPNANIRLRRSTPVHKVDYNASYANPSGNRVEAATAAPANKTKNDDEIAASR